MKTCNTLIHKYSTIILLTCLFAGCSKKETPFVFPANPEAGQLIELAPSTDKTTGLKIHNYMLLVSENREKSHSRIIALPIQVYPSSNPIPSEPLFILNGGPGSTNFTYQPTIELLEEHDVVAVGYRGVDGPAKLDCPELFDVSRKHDLFSEENMVLIENNMTGCIQKMIEEGMDLEGYNMLQVVEDMEDARKALKYERIHLMSTSYGTRLAQFYAYLYPESISRSVMVAVNPPGHFVWEPETIDEQIRYLAKLYHPHQENGAESLDMIIKRVNNNMPKRWMFIRIDPAKVRMATFMGLYNRSGMTSVIDTYLKADQGDASGLALISIMFNMMLKKGGIVWGDSYAKAYPDFNPDRDYLKDMALNNSILGSPASQIFASMDVWPGYQIPAEYQHALNSDVETLLVSGSIDFSTPSEFATNELLPFLSRGKQVILSEMGHQDLRSYNPEAFYHLLLTFLESGAVDDSMFEKVPMDFTVEMSFPKMAKMGLLILAGLILILIMVTWIILRKIRKRRKKKKWFKPQVR